MKNKKFLLSLMLCLLFGGLYITQSTSYIYASETNEEASKEKDEEKEETDPAKDVINDILESDPLSDENVEKGKTIFSAIIDAAIPFIVSFLNALYDFFVAIGRAILSALESF